MKQLEFTIAIFALSFLIGCSASSDPEEPSFQRRFPSSGVSPAEPMQFFPVESDTSAAQPNHQGNIDSYAAADILCFVQLSSKVVQVGQKVIATLRTQDSVVALFINRRELGATRSLEFSVREPGTYRLLGEVIGEGNSYGRCFATLTVSPAPQASLEHGSSAPAPAPAPANHSTPAPRPSFRPLFINRYFGIAHHYFTIRTEAQIRQKRNGHLIQWEGAVIHTAADAIPNSHPIYLCATIGGEMSVVSTPTDCRGAIIESWGYLLNHGDKPVYYLGAPDGQIFVTANAQEYQGFLQRPGYQDRGILGYMP